MTLIVRLPVSFTDTTIAKLSKDSVIPSSGARLLVDMKSVGTWPSQAASITTSDQLFSLVDNSWPTLSTAGTHVYSPERGGLLANELGDASTGLWLSNTSTNIFNDATHAWAFTFWFYRALASTSRSHNFFRDNTVQIGGNAISGPIVMSIYGANGTNNDAYLIGGQFNVLVRLGFAVYQNESNIWKFRTVVNNTVSAEANLSGATNTVGGAGIRASNSATIRPRVFTIPAGHAAVTSDNLFYRTYAEDLTLSGRTYQQVFDADWARGNGRYS
jgi:hypothetical protein